MGGTAGGLLSMPKSIDRTGLGEEEQSEGVLGPALSLLSGPSVVEVRELPAEPDDGDCNDEICVEEGLVFSGIASPLRS